jgi:hypothetical protein
MGVENAASGLAVRSGVVGVGDGGGGLSGERRRAEKKQRENLQLMFQGSLLWKQDYISNGM